MESLETNESKEYEISFLTREESETAELRSLIGSKGAEITFEGTVRKIALAYPIKRSLEAFFGFFHVRSSPDQVRAVDEALRMHPAVLRHLIITPPFVRLKPKGPSVPRLSREAPRRAVRGETTARPAVSPLSNEALEKKIEEILQ